jgi:hypothetical protein
MRHRIVMWRVVFWLTRRRDIRGMDRRVKPVNAIILEPRRSERYPKRTIISFFIFAK